MMSTRIWQGGAAAVAQVANATFGTYDVATTRTITIGGVGVGAVDSGGTLTAALTALAVVLNASTHPYFAAITWSSNATQIIGTADVAGVPFVFLASVSGGTGSVSNTYTVATASAGPNDWSTAGNWSGQTLPVDADTVIFKESSVSVAWGLDQSTINPALLRIDQTYTGLIGLRRDQFARAIDGTNLDTSVVEYRSQYLSIGPTIAELGQNFTSQASSGSGRLKLNFGTDACTCIVYNTASNPSDQGQTAVQILADDNATDVFVRLAPGGVGVAIGPGEVSTVRLISVSDTTTASKVYAGPGVTLTTWAQKGGVNLMSPAATVTTTTVEGGTLTVEGSQVLTTVNVFGGTLNSNTTGTIGTLNLDGTSAVVDFQQSNQPRTVTTTNLKRGTFKADGSVLTTTTLNDPANKFSITTTAN
jgi:hypothetical protein